MTSTTSITLNLQLPNTAVTVNAKQNDRLSRYISASLYDGSVAFVPPVGVSAAIRYKKPDGTGGFYDVDEDANPAIVITGSTALLTLAEQCTTVPGEVFMELNFYTAAGDKLTSFTWLLKVEQSVLTDATIVSSNYYNVLTAAIATTLGYRDAAAASATSAEYWAGVAQNLTAGIKGYFATPAALTAAYPTGQNGWWAIVGTTDTIWVWDSDTSAWVDTGDVSDFYTKTESNARFATAAQGAKADTAVQPAGLIATSVSIADAGGLITATNVEGALQELAAGWSQLTIPSPTVSGNIRTYTFDMSGKNESEIGLRILANGYAPIDLRVLPAPYAGTYIVNYQDANLTSRTIVTVSISGETLTISVDSVYLSTTGAYSVLGMFLWR